VLHLTPLGEGDIWVGATTPNPFTAQTSLELRLPEGSHVRAEIVDALGNLVRRVAEGELPAGTHTLRWDGTTETGAPAATGTYLWRLFLGDRVVTQPMTLVR
jgi:flagellar hook assembly protein FlgD